jgi:hypothetical protein
MSRSRFVSPVLRGSALALLVAVLPGCTATTRTDTASSYLMIDVLAAASGAKPDTFGGNLASDVLTLVKRDVGGTQVFVPTVFEDLARVTFRLGMKDPGSNESPTTPSSANFITVTRYHVDYIRSDGRNTPGVDVPFGFDGAITVTVGGATATAAMTLVRIQAKNEAPLKALVGGNGGLAISTIARITFYGKDQAGREVSVAGQISVNFADWGDPA